MSINETKLTKMF